MPGAATAPQSRAAPEPAPVPIPAGLLRVNLSDGRTETFRLGGVGFSPRVPGPDAWETAQADPTYQGRITGAALSVGAISHATARPGRFRSVRLLAEAVRDREGGVVGYRVGWHADQVCVEVLIYVREPGFARTSIERIGVLRVPAPPRRR